MKSYINVYFCLNLLIRGSANGGIRAPTKDYVLHCHSVLYRSCSSRLGSDWIQWPAQYVSTAVYHSSNHCFASANLSFPQEFNISDAKYLDDANTIPNPNYLHNLWLVRLINSAPYIASALLGCQLSDPLNNYFGRRGTTFVAGIFCLFSVIGSGYSQTWYQLFVTCILLGIGQFLLNAPVARFRCLTPYRNGLRGLGCPDIYTAENVPASIRGGLVMSWQLWTAFGNFLAFCANFAVYNVGKIAWRLQLGSAFIPAVPLVIGIYFCSESPRWYMKKVFRMIPHLLRKRLTYMLGEICQSFPISLPTSEYATPSLL